MVTPQRALRAHRATRPVPHPRNSTDHQAWLARRLTSRDRWLVRMLFEHKVFTTHQIVDLAFPSHRAANLRLLELFQWGVLHRFQPHRDIGSHPMHYVLDSAGATLLAHEAGIEPSRLNYHRDREIGRAHSLQLAHLVGANGLFTALVRRSRPPGAAMRLTAWWSATRCARNWGDIVIPDGYGRWSGPDHDVEWFLEFDMSTETLTRLSGKVARYERLAAKTGITTPVLVWFRSAQREANARIALLDAQNALRRSDLVPIATTHADAAADPLDASGVRWLGIGDSTSAGRVSLADVPGLWPRLPAPAPLPAHSGDSAGDLEPPCPLPPSMVA